MARGLRLSSLRQPGGKAFFAGTFVRGLSAIDVHDRLGARHHRSPARDVAHVGAINYAPHQVGRDLTPLLNPRLPLRRSCLLRRPEISGPTWRPSDANDLVPVLPG